MTHSKRFACSFIAALSAGCMYAPQNGTTFTQSNIQSTQITLKGAWNTPSTQVEVQALSDPNQASWIDSEWTHVAFATTADSSHPFYWPNQATDPTPLYAWQVTITPSANGMSFWTQGGVARVRARVSTPNGLQYAQVYDDDFTTCLGANPNAQWQQLGGLCGDQYPDIQVQSNLPPPSSGVGTVAGFVSTTPVPADHISQYVQAPYLSWAFGQGSTTNTSTYYTTINAAATVAAFQSQYGYSNATDVARAIYYNQYDIGLGVDLSCWSFANNGDPHGGRACTLNYYGTQLLNNVRYPTFNDQNNGLTQATSGTGRFSTLAMAYEPSDAANPIKFIAYDANGNRTTTAQLDFGPNGSPYGTGGYTAVPNNCLACHGGTAQLSQQYTSLTGAHFLPLDEFSLAWSGSAPWRQQDQEDQIRQLDSHVLHAAPSPGVSEFLNGLYPQASGSPGPGPDYAQNTASATYIPVNWNGDRAAQMLYKEVDSHYCRNCHMAMDPAAGGLDWMNYSHFVTSPTGPGLVCAHGGHQMPQAEQTSRLFWQSPARAHYVAGVNANQLCAP